MNPQATTDIYSFLPFAVLLCRFIFTIRNMFALSAFGRGKRDKQRISWQMKEGRLAVHCHAIRSASDPRCRPVVCGAFFLDENLLSPDQVQIVGRELTGRLLNRHQRRRRIGQIRDDSRKAGHIDQRNDRGE